jgi:hypothetical protein
MILYALKRKQTRQLLAIVRRVRVARRRHRYVPTEEMLQASVAVAIIKQRRKK